MKGHFTMSSKEADRIPVIERLLTGEIKAKHAARELNLSVRQIRRLKKRYKREGAAGLVHKSRGRASNHKIPSGEIDRAIEIIREKCWDFGPTLALEKLKKYHGVEKVNSTLQDRLVKELRLLGISDMKTANAYLPEFIKEFNSKFAVCPKEKQKAYRPLLPSDNLRKILVKRFTRTLSKNLEISYKNIRYQIKTDRPTYAMRHARVIVTEDRFGKVRIYYKGKELKYKVLLKRPKAEIVDAKNLNPKVDEIKLRKEYQAVLINKLKKPKWKPAANHPWRQSRTFLFGR